MGTNSVYATLQTGLLCIFALVFFFDDRPPLFPAGMSRTGGSVLCVVGLLLMFSAFAAIRSAVQIAPEPKRGAQLASTGVYRKLRHPIYTAILLLAIGLFLRKPTATIAATAAAVVVFLVIKVRFEEQLLLARYPEYAEYRNRTWGLIPGLRR